MIRKINRIFQDYMREKRLKIGKNIWDRKNKEKIIEDNNFIEDNNIKSILFLRYDGKIGDMVINTIMFREIKKSYPEIKIGVVTRGGAKDIISNNKNVDKIYEYNKKTSEVKKLAREIALEKYDLLIDFSEMLRVNQMMFINMCKAKINIGINKKDWNLFEVSLKSIDYHYHISNLYLEILKFLGIKNIVRKYDLFPTNYMIEKLNLKNKKYVVFNPYAASKHRSFNLENMIKISEIILEKNFDKLILIGTKNHLSELERIKKRFGDKIIIPETENILEVVELISKANLVVTPDTSIVHIAATFERKMLCIYRREIGKEDKNSILWGPNYDQARVIYVDEKVKNGEEIDINKIKIEKLKEKIDEI
ncbi:glycosyltransferase family 9 protein [Fusobacterium perfoetens]|uniref:glycosyltransferase family 9 protein n=1 Tax=Fusobacterium perfoetens TaxID=852 RepID=UPI001F161DB4|nr:glycosyltransferase family 9 protein [Fusobacterium perfoetens]MCF2625502.1 glycosyltransferase family 9 protein [Fusobacterium perfoetens]